ncbi:MAG TPA: Calx-beta domain-containing protein [Chloroflexota bacterium]|nr:Calx-beta domain-containing protein [Chloroflexota bacterium]
MRRLILLLIVSVVATAVLALFTLFTPTAQADQVGGVIDTDTTWTLAGSPYIITETIIIQPGVTLTVEAGVEVQAQPNRGITVNGLLLALGTAVQPITFTSTTESGFNDWHGLDVTSSGTVSLTHTTIRRAYASLEISGITANPVQLSHSHIHHNLVAMGSDVNAIHRLAMHNVTFSDNQFNYVWMGGVSGVLSDDVTLTDQPGLEGYVVGSSPFVTVPEGITLTMEAGTTFQFDYLFVHGHLETQGSVTATTVITGFSVTQIEETGSANINHTLMANGIGDGYVGLGILGNSSQPIHIQNSTIAQMVHPLVATADALHRLHMENVTFANNLRNRVFINGYSSGELAGNVSLTPQPGLEGYEYEFDNNNNGFTVPEGITLTLESGAVLMMPQGTHVQVDGHLEATGTAVTPVTFTSATNPQPNAWAGIYVLETGSVNIENAVVQHGIWGILVLDDSDNPVHLTNSTLRQNGYGLHLPISGLHRLQMENVAFQDNIFNRIRLNGYDGQALTDNVTLTSQPGLEGYELGHTSIEIPEGITLTLNAGVTLMAEDNVLVAGHLQANGTVSEPVTITSVDDPAPGAWGVMVAYGSGSMHLENSIVEYAAVGLYSFQNASSSVRDSIFRENEYPIVVSANNLHLLQLDNVSFENNVRDRVFIYSTYGEMIVDDVSLRPHPGLEGYQVDGDNDLVIQSGVTLTMAAGSTLMMNPAANPFRELLVHGRLQAKGTAVAPITFTSSEDSAPGQWQGIVVDGGEVSLAHAEVRYAAANLTVNSPTSTVSITGSRLISASVNSLTINDGVVNAACSVISGNGQNGVSVAASGSPSVTITTSEIWGNGVGITNSHSLPVDARHNFWGHPSGPGGIGPGSGDAVYGNVLYAPWLSEPTCSPPPPPGPPIVSITDSTAVESAPSLTFTITLNITSEQDVLVDYETVDGTAVAYTDYLPISGTLTIPAGQVTAVLTVTLLNNDLDDGDRTFTLVLNNPVNAELGNDTAVGLILDDDSPTEPLHTIFLPVVIKP